MNPFTFGSSFQVKVLGSSHGPFVGVEVRGVPAGLEVSEEEIQRELDKRKPGQNSLTTQRREEDRLVVLSGLNDGRTTGGVLRMKIENKDVRMKDYSQFASIPRPGHADMTSVEKFGKTFPGGGVFSGRMTAAFVMAGAVAKALIRRQGIRVNAHLCQAGKVRIRRQVSDKELAEVPWSNDVHTAAAESAGELAAEIDGARRDGDSVGGLVECRIRGLKPGLGDPMFGSIESRISAAAFAIPAVKGIEFGSGFEGATWRGSRNNDAFALEGGKVVTKTNNCGGILGGLATGMPIVFRAAFKPTSSIAREQKTLDLATGRKARLRIAGRHDPCIAIRAVPVVEAIAAMVIADIVSSR
ncbi:MAG: chorismate synthase [Candidatus Micrarchaeota archaeon]